MEEKKNPLSATIGLLLSVVVAVGLGWFARSIYQNTLDAEAQAKAVEAAAAAAAVKPVTVETAQVTLKAINPPQSFMGHVEPILDVDLRAQIEGTIDAVAFQEGATVKEGDLLYRIDPRVYEARVAQAKAALAEAEARSENANRYYERISKVDKRSVTEAEIDQAYADKLEAQAAIEQCKADLKSAEINLGYCEIRAPISGRIGQSLLKKGDYVSPSLGTLARIVQMDPVRVVFSVPDRAYLQGKTVAGSQGLASDAIRAQIRLADGSIYAHDGKADFIGNESPGQRHRRLRLRQRGWEGRPPRHHHRRPHRWHGRGQGRPAGRRRSGDRGRGERHRGREPERGEPLAKRPARGRRHPREVRSRRRSPNHGRARKDHEPRGARGE